MHIGRRARVLAACGTAGVALCWSIANAAPAAAAEPARRVPMAASDVRPPVPVWPVALAASAAGQPEPPGMASPQCEGLLGEVRQACIERTAPRRR